MKKTLVLTTILLIFLMIPQFSYADSYSFNDGSINIELGKGVTASTSSSDVPAIPEAPKDFELLVTADDLGYYWYFYHMNNNSSMDFTAMTDEQILALIESDSTEVDTENVSQDVYDNGAKYLMIDSYIEDTDQYIHYYVTGVGNALYYFIAPSKGSLLSDAQKADFRNAIDGVTFVKKEAPSELAERQASMIRIIKRFAVAFGALAIFVVIKLAVEKIKGTAVKK